MSKNNKPMFNWYWDFNENGLSLDFAYGSNAPSRVFDFKVGGRRQSPPQVDLGSVQSRITNADGETDTESSSSSSGSEDANEEEAKVDDEAAYAQLVSLDGLAKYSEELAGVRRRIEIWAKQGAPTQKRIDGLHAAIFSWSNDADCEFARAYHTFLVAAGILTTGREPHFKDGSKKMETWGPEPTNGDLCLIMRAHKLTKDEVEKVAKMIESSGAVFVFASRPKDQLPDGLSKIKFNLQIYFPDEKVRDPMDIAQEYIKAWLKEYSSDMFIEEGVEGGWAKTFAKKVVKQTNGKEDAVKAALKGELKDVEERQGSRLIRDAAADPDPCEFSREDLLGEEPKLGSNDKGPWKDLRDMVGLEQVKDAMRMFEAQVVINHYRAMVDHQPAKFGLNRLFLGPPGTGKTTVGKLYGEILGNMKLLDPGGFVLKKGSDFIEGFTGQSEVKTREILEETKGKVLMIDEAYMLDPDVEGTGYQEIFRKGVLDTIVGECMNTAEENRAVILVGYKRDMEKLLRANPGLPSRFPMEDAFIFEQFDEEQLRRVLTEKLSKRQSKMTDDAFGMAMDALELGKQSRDFGNGRAVEKLLDRAGASHTLRLSKMTFEERRDVMAQGTVYLPQDVDPKRIELHELRAPIKQKLEDMVGVEQVRERLCSYPDLAKSMRDSQRDVSQFMPFHFAFKGPSGTGKKIVARNMAWLYHSMRLLATDEIVFTSVRELIKNRLEPNMQTGGQSRTFKNIMEQAVSRVLIIDNADQLFGEHNEQARVMVQGLREEIAEEIIKPEFSRNVVVILVGTEPKLDRVLESPGFGIFQERLEFKGLTNEDCLNRLQLLLEKEDIQVLIDASDRQELDRVFEILCRSIDWANHRDLKLIANELVRSSFGRQRVRDGKAPSVSGSQILSYLRDRFPRQLSKSSDRSRSETRKSTHKSSASLEVPKADVRASSAQPQMKKSRSLSPLRFEQPKTEASSFESPSISVKRSDSVNAYDYRELPSEEHIRVLRLEPSSQHDDPIRCSLSDMKLDEETAKAVHYDALSYSWDSMERTRPIECGGGSLLITKSCELALRYLRRADASSVLWIDVVCINQDSDEEKSVQVGLMGDVYRFASRVLVWLGEDPDPQGQGLADLKVLCDAQRDGVELEMDSDENIKHFTTLNTMMQHRWWKRVWTFQEFVLAKDPIFVIAHTHISWQEFSGVLLDLITQRHRREDETKQEYLKAAKSAIISQLFQDCGGIANELEASIHMIPTWLEVMDVFVCRAAYSYGMELSEERRQLLMSHYLLKTRNRSAGNPRDNIYGLYYLFKVSGFKLPRPDYKLSVSDVYKGAAEALLQQSSSWWILSQLLNKRDGTNLVLPSWVPDFSSRAIWHQGVDLRFQNVHSMMRSFEREELQANERAGIDFDLRKTDSGVETKAVFLWTVKKRTEDVRPHPTLDRAFEEKFEQIDNHIVEDAIEEFFFKLAEWLTIMESSASTSDEVSQQTEEEQKYLESQVMEAISCTYWRASWKFVRSFGKPSFDISEDEEPSEDEPERKQIEKPDVLPRDACRFMHTMLATVRSCMRPDMQHPCVCGRIDLHDGNGARECFTKWIESQPINGLQYVKYWLYCRAIDHSLFLTDAPEGCKGHFGFCRNSPREKDDIVLFPGLADPVIIRKRGVDTYQVVGVTSGMVGPAVYNGEQEVEGAFCFGSCLKLEKPEEYDVRTLTLI